MNLTTISEQISEFDDEIKELKELVPYAKNIVSAYKWAKKKRIVYFLRTLNQEISEWNFEQKEKFEKHILSGAGSELLSEYSDTVLRTSSRIGISSLALLYSDVSNDIYDSSFKRTACYAIEGINDISIEMFLLLMSLPIKHQDEKPYIIHFLKEEDIKNSNELNNLIGNPDNIFALVNGLIRRGILLPDHTSGRLSGRTWSCIYGSGGITHQFIKLFLRAKEALLKSK